MELLSASNNHKDTTNKRFCPRNHDTNVFGRNKNRRCKECEREDKRYQNMSAEKIEKERKRLKNKNDVVASDPRRKMLKQTKQRLVYNEVMRKDYT